MRLRRFAGGWKFIQPRKKISAVGERFPKRGEGNHLCSSYYCQELPLAPGNDPKLEDNQTHMTQKKFKKFQFNWEAKHPTHKGLTTNLFTCLKNVPLSEKTQNHDQSFLKRIFQWSEEIKILRFTDLVSFQTCIISCKIRIRYEALCISSKTTRGSLSQNLMLLHMSANLKTAQIGRFWSDICALSTGRQNEANPEKMNALLQSSDLRSASGDMEDMTCLSRELRLWFHTGVMGQGNPLTNSRDWSNFKWWKSMVCVWGGGRIGAWCWRPLSWTLPAQGHNAGGGGSYNDRAEGQIYIFGFRGHWNHVIQKAVAFCSIGSAFALLGKQSPAGALRWPGHGLKWSGCRNSVLMRMWVGLVKRVAAWGPSGREPLANVCLNRADEDLIVKKIPPKQDFAARKVAYPQSSEKIVHLNIFLCTKPNLNLFRNYFYVSGGSWGDGDCQVVTTKPAVWQSIN